ncbi:MAG: bifunctional UDP-N-acetylglucosamine diphosphorylase/glucosamine-1-phosphate N-acetyltransferase GlmU [Nitrosomonas sp.]|nr:bifunctional UDP-N-acetylglucosamine diphosphorylase/glucosamine-1-phosphate N-acetyltransferase GlmU [Nitrosomonas sp.]MDP1949802.1 bifunctional UDP-N-acetylglucosamine diphosphorylase/glucosamine-1-phosphate N-acetyltransferase GlmU [Nitrosomonas sp.]
MSKSSKLNIVILAAGLGKRMRSSIPKVLHGLGGKPLLAHVLKTARVLSPKNICIVYGYGGDMVRQAITDTDLNWIQQTEQLGTGHALLQALPSLSENGLTLILFGDVPLVRSETLDKLIHASENKSCALLSVELEKPQGYGRIIRDVGANKVIAIVEEKDASLEEKEIREINTGMMVIPNQLLHKWLPNIGKKNKQNEYYLTDIIAMAVKQGIDVVTVKPVDAWEILGVNSKHQLAALERIYQRNCADKLLDQGVSLADPSRIDIRGELICGHDVEIDINCIFEGKVILGDNVIIKANNILKNVSVAAGTIIAPNCLIEDTVIGEICQIGPYARFRPKTELGNNVHIGNFVEVKNSTIATGTKASHLSYIGDTLIGRNVNIGAGTITCNYDGVNKHQTIIEDNVFIGSDSQLIAPVTVAEGAVIGAGSTITRNAPPGKLTLSRSKQVSVAGWIRPVKNKK